MTRSEGTMLLMLLALIALTASVAFGAEVHVLISHVENALDAVTAPTP